MRPTNSNEFAHGNNSSNTIVWTGKDVPCLGIKYGDILTKVIHTIACKVCDLAADIDVSTVDISCLIDAPNLSPSDKNVKTILQLLLDNQCELKDLIDAIETGESGDPTLTLNLKCLKKFDEFDNEIPQNLNQTLQSIVNQVCDNKDDIAIIKQDIIDLQELVEQLEDIDPYTEPSITTCLNVQSRPVSQVVPIAATAICNINTILGNSSDVSGAIGRQCASIPGDVTSALGWVSSPTNLAHTVNNIWLLLCNINARVTAIEQTCCAPSCDKIKLGFQTDINYDDQEMTLTFTSGAGTSIPSGFVDCGTVLTITDKDGTVKTFQDLEITMNEAIGPLDISGLASGVLTLSFKTKFCLKDENDVNILVCQDCITEEVNYFNDTCCTIVNNGTAAVTIIFSSCAESND